MNLNSYLTLSIHPNASDSIPFKITKAIIKESLEELFSIECEGYIESLEENLFSFTSLMDSSSLSLAVSSSLSSYSKNSNSTQNPNFHPKVLIDNLAIFSINNPYPDKTLSIDMSANKTYQGIISYVNYLGIHKESLRNLTDIDSTIKTLRYKHFFSFKVESILKRLSLNKSSRIYTNKNILEVIKETLDFYQGTLHKTIDFSNIHSEYATQELISQYQESDLEFITRLAHNNGIFFYEDTDTIYFCDTYTKTTPKDIKYNPNINNVLNEPCITQLHKEQSLRANAFTHSSIQASTPLNLLSLNSKEVPYEENLNNKAIYKEHTYESASSFSQGIDLKTPPSIKERRVITLNESLMAKSNIYHLSLRDFISIDYHTLIPNTLKDSNKDSQTDFVLIANTQTLIDDAILANSIDANDNIPTQDMQFSKSYSNTLTLLPTHFLFTPNPKPKPKAPNSTQGIVIGKGLEIEQERNTIYTDEYGRVKVRINLYANQEEIDNALYNSLNTNNANNTNSNNNPKGNTNNLNNQEALKPSSNPYKSYHHTPFLRVSSPIASNHSGFYHTPRIGDEVIISFLDEDIDKPYISGSLYNGYNPSLVNLPYNDHQTSLSSKTIGVNEEGYNELTLSNIKDKEQIYLEAEKDYDELIQHNFTQRILNNKDSIVNGIYNERIKKLHTQTIDLAKNVNIGGEYLINVALSKDTQVGLSNTLNVGVDNKLRVAKNSSEYIGEDKEIEIGSNQNTIIHKDENRNVEGNKKEVVGGHYDIQSAKEFNLTSEEQINVTSNHNILFSTQKSTGFESDKNHTEMADNIAMEAKTNIEEKAGNQINFIVGETTITAKGDSVIIKAGGVEVVIDSKGLLVKGGEVRAE